MRIFLFWVGVGGGRGGVLSLINMCHASAATWAQKLTSVSRKPREMSSTGRLREGARHSAHGPVSQPTGFPAARLGDAE